MPQKIKSHRGGVEVFVSQKVRWQHKYAFAGSNKESITYDQLTMGQWMAGFCRAMWEEINEEAMLDYLIFYWIIRMRFPGVLQRPAMQCCFVVWSREILKILLKLTR